MNAAVILAIVCAVIGDGVRAENTLKQVPQRNPIGFMQDDVPSDGDSCYHLIRKVYGHCAPPESCSEVRKDFQKGIQPQICSYEENRPIVCCPRSSAVPAVATPPPSRTSVDYPTSPPPRRISDTKCEEYAELGVERTIVGAFSVGERSNNTVEKPKCALSGGGGFVVGGTVTKLGEFPHMTAIGWRDEDNKLEFKCGGSLISYRFVLSAGHCASAQNRRPSVARLGEQNIQSDDDGAIIQDIEIVSIVRHPQYKPTAKYYDIALFRLERRVTITDNVRPACLWQRHDIEYASAIATGWGLTRDRGSPSNELLKVSLRLIDNSRCFKLFHRYTSSALRNGIVESQLCAGDDRDEKDTCSGDSGNCVERENQSPIK